MSLQKRIKKRIIEKATDVFLKILKNNEVKRQLWEIQRGHLGPGTDYRWQKNIQAQLWEKASEQTADYVLEKMIDIESVQDRSVLFKKCFSEAKIEGNTLEFGVQEGESIKIIAEIFDGTVHGFDSFQGLPAKWFDQFRKGQFSCDAKLPDCPDNVKLHAGWFEDTLPEFVSKYPQPVRFMHVDCDLYASAKTVFQALADKIQAGTVIQFDEYFNYPSWQNHEFKAFQEFIAAHNRRYEYIGYVRDSFAAAVKILQ